MRRTKMGGSSMVRLRRWEPEDRRFFHLQRTPHLRRNPSHLRRISLPIFEEPPHIFDDSLHLRRTPPSTKNPSTSSKDPSTSSKNPFIFEGPPSHLRRTPHHFRSSEPKIEEPPILDLRSRRTKNTSHLQSSIFGPENRRTFSIFDFLPRRMCRRSAGRRGGCDFFEDGGSSKMGGFFDFPAPETKNPPIFHFLGPENEEPSHLLFIGRKNEEPPVLLLRSLPSRPNQPSPRLLGVHLQTDFPQKSMMSSRASKTTVLNDSSEARTKEIL